MDFSYGHNSYNFARLPNVNKLQDIDIYSK